MSNTWLKYVTRISLPIASLLSVVILAAWIPSLLTKPIAEVCATAGLMMLNATLLWFMIRETGGGREYNGLPFIVTMMAITAIPALHDYWQGQVVALMVFWVILSIHRSYLEQDNMAAAFRNTLILYIASLIVEDVIWLIPMLWIGYFILGAMHLRAWMASLMALVFVAIWTAIFVYLGWMDMPFTDLLNRSWLLSSVYDWNGWTMIGIMVLNCIFLLAALRHTDRDSISRRKLFALLGWATLFAAVLTLFPASNKTLFPIVQSALAGIAVLYLLQEPSVARGRMFIFYIVSCVLLYAAPFVLTRFLTV